MATPIATGALHLDPFRRIDELAIAKGGAFALAQTPVGLRLLDLDAGRESELPPATAFGCVGREAWTLGHDRAWFLDRYAPTGDAIGDRVLLPELGATVHADVIATGGAPMMLACGDARTVEIAASPMGVAVGACALEMAGGAAYASRSWVAINGRGLTVHRPSGTVEIALPSEVAVRAAVVGAALVFDGAALAVAVAAPRAGYVVLADIRRGALIAHLRFESVDRIFLVPDRNHAVLWRAPGTLAVFDLRARRLAGERIAADGYRTLAIDPAGRTALLVDATRPTEVIALPYTELLRVRPVGIAEPPATTAEVAEPEPAAPESAAPEPDVPPALALVADVAPAPEAAPLPRHPLADLAELSLDALAPHAVARVLDPADQRAFGDRLFALVAAWCRRALAEGWDSGRITSERSALPFQIEAAAVLDRARGRAADPFIAAQDAELAANRAFRAWSRPDAPHVALARDFELSPLAVLIALAAAAPQLWPDLARVYAQIAADPARPMLDEHLLVQLLGMPAAEIARELDEDAPLVRHGIIALAPGHRPACGVVAHRLVVQRLAGTLPSADNCVRRRAADRELEEIHAPATVLAELVRYLNAPGPGPARVLLRGRSGSGRRTIAAALAARAGRVLGVIDTGAFAHRGPEALRACLRETALRGWVPCLVGIDHLGDAAARAAARTVLDGHHGAVFACCELATPVPFGGDHHVAELPVLGHHERAHVIAAALASAGLPADDAPALATRFAISPGTVQRIVARAATGSEGALAHRIADAMRVTRAARLREVAHRVEHLPAWSQVVLPPDTIDSVRSFVGRVRHRRQVFEDWGMAAVATTSRGQTALFQGAPGTGKTLVAGAIARELGYELYRVDVSQIMSKWLGETEKNLAKLFDAAEEGECVLLFDEADSLFTRRTEVRSSNDRYANLEVNYLLQRLDTFEGIAILTTNFGSAIDPAFRRRLSSRVTFPFPDEDMRLELWRAHLPPNLPTTGELDLPKLARRFQLSGGYIRNAVVRAAYLAAEERVSVSSDLLVRAVRLELAEIGKLGESGPVE